MRTLSILLGAALFIGRAELGAAQTAAPGADTTIVSGDRARRADSALRAAEVQGFSGVVLVVDHGLVALRKGYGLAVRERKQPFAPGTVVQIGSNTKDFTAVAILQLQERGKLSVHDSLGRYFKSVPTDKRAITIWDLVTHRSGLPLYSGKDFDAVSREEFVAHVMTMPLLFAPGTDQRYSNAGYSVLAAIIELVSGDTFGGYVTKNIWQPLGMHETGLLLVKWDTTRLAHGYQGGEDVGTMLDRPHANDGPYWNLRGNGGYLSTVADMYHFYAVLFDSTTLLAPSSRDLRFPRDRSVGLAGSDMINFFLYERAPRADVVLIMASNSSEYPVPRARDGVAAAFGLPLMNGIGGVRVGGRSPAVNAASAASVALPETPAGRRAGEYVALFNSRDTAAMRRFLQDSTVQGPDDHRTIDQRLSTYRGMRTQVGVMTPVAVVSSGASEIALKVVTERGETVKLTVSVESAAPNRIVRISIETE